MAAITVALINATSRDAVLTDTDALAAFQALQTQAHRDFAPIWGIDADLVFTPRGAEPPKNAWWLSLLDTSDQATAFGYHDLTSEGLPLGKVFVASDKAANQSWTSTASHELLEMLVDPDINPARTPGRNTRLVMVVARRAPAQHKQHNRARAGTAALRRLRSFWDAAQKEWPLTGQVWLPSLHDGRVERAANRPVGWDVRLR